LTLTMWTLTSPDLPYRLLGARTVGIFPRFTAYSALHTVDISHEFVLFNFALSSNIKPSQLSTDHCICFYVTWTDILHHEIVLLLKGENKFLLKIEPASTLEQSLVPVWLSEYN
jgi:hypothetical protein